MVTIQADDDGAGIVITPAGDIATISGLDSLRQKVLRKLRLWQGEFFLDITAGVPYRQQIFQRPVDAGIASTIITSQISSEPDVTEVRDISVDLDRNTRMFSYSATVASTYGEFEVSV